MGFPDIHSDWVRYTIAGGLLVGAFLSWKASQSEEIITWHYSLVCIFTVAVAVAGISVGVGVVISPVTAAFMFFGFFGVRFGVGSLLVGMALFVSIFLTFDVSNILTLGFWFKFATVLFSLVLGFIILVIVGSRRPGRLYFIATVLLVIAFAITPALLSHSAAWNGAPLLLFFCVLVVVNAPLDWLTFGVTRALLWRGVDQRGLSPFLWGLVDIVVALILLVILSVVMILGIQLFNAAAVFGIRESTDQAIIDAAVIINPAELVNGMAHPATRKNPEYWWVYATLFSTLLPSWFHMLVASGCFVRGSTRLNQVIGNDLLEGKHGAPLLPHTQTKLAALLGLQRTFGLALATTVFFGGLWFVFFVLFPEILPLLLDVAVPLSGSDWATRFVGTIADFMGLD